MKITLKILLSALIISFLSFLFPAHLTSSANLFAQDNGLSSQDNYDYVLIIDESGSMKKNDPQNMRIDAAKLFIYLAEILNRGNRALISGFGESTNIYLPITEISGNEDEISSAIDKIKSNQQLTDMKGALEKIKSILDGRQEKQKTAVIFLTDGSLTINDIPAQSEEDKKPEKEKPGKGKDVEGHQEEIPGDIIGEDKISNQLFSESVESYSEEELTKGQKQYLEDYKKGLLDLCYSFKQENIVIYPIAFTKEADIELLEQIASITSGACWKAESASDIRNSYLEILKNLTSRFIKIEEQTESEALAGEIEVGGYVKELVVLSLKNKIQPKPSIDLIDPTDAQAEYDEFIQESIFKIAKIDNPAEGKWKYEIDGDAVFIYSIVDSFITEPYYSIYTTGAEVQLKINILGLFSENPDVKSSDFEVSCSIKDPQGSVVEYIELVDDGTDIDEKANDGIFSGIYSSTDLKGNYLVTFEIKHLPTSSISNKNINFEVVKLPAKISIIEPARKFYLINTDVKVFVKLEQVAGSQERFNPTDYEITFNILYPDCTKAHSIMLLDNGTGADVKSGDGIFSSLIVKPEVEGEYILEFFIRHIPSMLISASTTQKALFEVKKAPEIEISIENNLFTDTDTIVHASFSDFSQGLFGYELLKPDDKILEGNLYDNGSLQNGDNKEGDGIYSAVFTSLDELGKYKITIQSEYQTEDASIPVSIGQEFSKDFQIKSLPGLIEVNSSNKAGSTSFTIVSKSSRDTKISINQQKIDSKIIKSLVLKDISILPPNSETEVKLDFQLSDDIKPGEYQSYIPVILEDGSEKEIKLDLKVVQVVHEFPLYLFVIVIAASVLAIAAIVLMVYFLYIRPKRRGY